MKHDRQTWVELLRLLDTALALDAPARQAWLQALPMPRQAHVRDLLLHQAAVETADFLNAGARLEAPAARTASAVTDGAWLAGQQVGPWRLLHLLGRGGMASVWLAEPAPDTGGAAAAPARRVALKLPHRNAAPGLAERLAKERDILAGLEHPNIARLYDAGQDEHGQPWLALEHVEGQAIDVHCRAQALDAPARLLLLLQVAQAMAHAHRQLVLHRDLKPSNILVTALGEVRLLDFGIAKLMHGPHTASSTLTQLEGRPLTPEYASPEQLMARPLGTPSDVYSLGVVAYQLLCGSLPYALQRGSAAELEEAILHAEIAPPSRRAGDARLRKLLRGDIDAVVLKALKKHPPERYPTMDALADDLSRLLRHEPVSAQPDAWHYRLRRWVQRHKLETGVAAAVVVAVPAGAAAQAAVMAALAVGAGATLWQARAARSHARAAQRDAERAEQVKRAALALFGDADSGAGAGVDTRAVDLLLASARRLSADAGMLPLVRAELQLALAYSLLGLGSVHDALPLAEAALATVRRGTPPPTLRMDALLTAAEALREAGRSPDAEPLLHEALAEARSAADVERQIRALNRLASVLVTAGHNSQALERSEEALALCDRHPQEVSALWQMYTAGSAGNIRRSVGLPFGAVARRALAASVRLYGQKTTLPVLQYRLMAAAAEVNEGDAQVGVAQLRGLHQPMLALLGPRHPTVAVLHRWWAQAELDIGRTDAALALLTQGLALTQDLEGPASANVALNYLAQGAVRLRAGHPALAMPALDTAIALFAAALGPRHPQRRRARALRALALAQLGDAAQSDLAWAELAVEADADVEAEERLMALHCDALAGRALPAPDDLVACIESACAATPLLRAAAIRADGAALLLRAGAHARACDLAGQAWEVLLPRQVGDSPELVRLMHLRERCQHTPGASASQPRGGFGSPIA